MASFVSGNRVGTFSQFSHREQRELILRDLVIKRWTEDPWQTGGYGLTRTPGAWTAFGSSWQNPHGKVFWAGTEQATRWPGYFEGAIEAGLAAARQAIDVIA
ncbi:FAD-dependent oxidoreductase [Parasynechococcus sp.]|uniref:FAD-dependent oxidoreductase n=1 Tax=Parasynechococcus sp. TaxID=3101203 RepID=UPI003703A36C